MINEPHAPLPRYEAHITWSVPVAQGTSLGIAFNFTISRVRTDPREEEAWRSLGSDSTASLLPVVMCFFRVAEAARPIFFMMTVV